MKKIELRHQICFLKRCLRAASGSKNKIKECIKALEAKNKLTLEIANSNADNYADIKKQNSIKIKELYGVLKEFLPDIEWQLDAYIKQIAKRNDKAGNRAIHIKNEIYSDIFGEFGFKESEALWRSSLNTAVKFATIFLGFIYFPYFIYVLFNYYFVPVLNLNQLLFSLIMGSAFILLVVPVLLVLKLFFITFFYKTLSLVPSILILSFCYAICLFLYFIINTALDLYSIWIFTFLYLAILLIFYFFNKFKIISPSFAISTIFIIFAGLFLWIIYDFVFRFSSFLNSNKYGLSFVFFLLGLTSLIFILYRHSIKAKLASLFVFCLIVLSYLSPISVMFAGLGNFTENMQVKNTKIIKEVFSYLPQCSDENKLCIINKDKDTIILKNIHIISIDANGYWVEIETKGKKDQGGKEENKKQQDQDSKEEVKNQKDKTDKKEEENKKEKKAFFIHSDLICATSSKALRGSKECE